MSRILILPLLFFVFNAKSQRYFNAGLIYGTRLNYNTDYFTRVMGASAEYNAPLHKAWNYRFSVGLEMTDPGISIADSNFFSKDLDDFWVVPVRVGLQYFLLNNRLLFFAEPGIAIGFFPFYEDNKTKVNLSYAFGGAYRFMLNERKYLQGGVSFNRNHYDQTFKFSWISFRLAYGGVGK